MMGQVCAWQHGGVIRACGVSEEQKKKKKERNLLDKTPRVSFPFQFVCQSPPGRTARECTGSPVLAGSQSQPAVAAWRAGRGAKRGRVAGLACCGPTPPLRGFVYAPCGVPLMQVAAKRCLYEKTDLRRRMGSGRQRCSDDAALITDMGATWQCMCSMCVALNSMGCASECIGRLPGLLGCQSALRTVARSSTERLPLLRLSPASLRTWADKEADF